MASRFFRGFSKVFKGPSNKDGHKTYYCRTCFHGYPSQEKLNEHIHKGCAGVVGQIVTAPNNKKTK